MATNHRQELHAVVDRLSDDEARRLSAMLGGLDGMNKAPPARPLTVADIILTAPVLPEEDSADDMIATVRHWRREGGYV